MKPDFVDIGARYISYDEIEHLGSLNEKISYKASHTAYYGIFNGNAQSVASHWLKPVVISAVKVVCGAASCLAAIANHDMHSVRILIKG